MTDQLTNHLRNMYKADVLGQGNFESALARAKDWVNSDAPSLAEAKARIPRLQAAVKSRGNTAYIEKKELEYLQQMVIA